MMPRFCVDYRRLYDSLATPTNFGSWRYTRYSITGLRRWQLAVTHRHDSSAARDGAQSLNGPQLAGLVEYHQAKIQAARSDTGGEDSGLIMTTGFMVCTALSACSRSLRIGKSLEDGIFS